MLTEKRYELILKLLDEQNSVTVAEIKEKLKISESTIRRDLNALDKAGKLNKVRTVATVGAILLWQKNTTKLALEG